MEVEAQAFLELKGMAQLDGIVAIERDDDRSLIAIFDRDARGDLHLARKIRPQALAFERQRQERLLARLGLDRGGEHPGRSPAGAAPGLAAVVHRDRAAGLNQPPGNAQADDAGPDDDCLRTLRGNDNGRANSGLPSPGMPGQVQWV